MTRGIRVAVVIGAVAGTGALAFGWTTAGREAAADQSAALPHLWQWPIERFPGRDRPSAVELVLRSRSDPFPVASAGPLAPLAWDEAESERVLRDHPVTDPRGGGRATVQLLDLGHLTDDPAAPPGFLLAAGLSADGGRVVARRRLDGHSVVHATAHPAGWVKDAMPLLTVRTVSSDRQHTYTLLLRMTAWVD